MSKAIITCAVNGVLTNPKQHHVPVTPEEMAAEARRAYEAGASVMHIHLRRQEPDQGHLGSWDIDLSTGEKVVSNGQLIEEMARTAREVGREIASPEEARQIMGLNPG